MALPPGISPRTTSQKGGSPETENSVSYGTVILVSVLAVLVVFIVMGCRMSCRKKRRGRWQEPYVRTSIENDTSGSGGFWKPVMDFAFAQPHNQWSDNPNFQANPQSIRQEIERGGYPGQEGTGMDFEAATRRVSENWNLNGDSNKAPLFAEFDQYYTGERAMLPDGTMLAGEPAMANALKVRDTLTTLGDVYSQQLMQNQIQPAHVNDIGMDWDQVLAMRARDLLRDPQSPRDLTLASRIRSNLDHKL